MYSLTEGSAEEIHDAADQLQAAAGEVMDCLHEFDRLDETDREFVEMELPSRLAKVREDYAEFQRVIA